MKNKLLLLTLVLMFGSWSTGWAANEVASMGNDFTASIHPNPYNNQFRVSISGNNDEMVSATLYDITGQVVEEKKGMPSDNDMTLGAGLARGVYMIKVTQGNNIKVMRVIKSE